MDNKMIAAELLKVAKSLTADDVSRIQSELDMIRKLTLTAYLQTETRDFDMALEHFKSIKMSLGNAEKLLERAIATKARGVFANNLTADYRNRVVPGMGAKDPRNFKIYRDKTTHGISYQIYTMADKSVGTFLEDEMDREFLRGWEKHIIDCDWTK